MTCEEPLPSPNSAEISRPQLPYIVISYQASSSFLALSPPQMSVPSEKPWYEAYPAPATLLDEVPSISKEVVLARLKKIPREERTFVLVDLRRSDHVGGAIRDSINVPAQSMYQSMPMLYELFARAGIEQVVWFCGACQVLSSWAQV